MWDGSILLGAGALPTSWPDWQWVHLGLTCGGTCRPYWWWAHLGLTGGGHI